MYLPQIHTSTMKLPQAFRFMFDVWVFLGMPCSDDPQSALPTPKSYSLRVPLIMPRIPICVSFVASKIQNKTVTDINGEKEKKKTEETGGI